jgi:ligand-binding sensor domain-containing protein
MTTVEGINRYDGMTMTTFMPQAEGSKSTPQFYYTMLESRDGTLWFCNYGAGLVRYDPVHDTWKYYQHDEHNPNSLTNDTLWWLYEDRDGIRLRSVMTLHYSRVSAIPGISPFLTTTSHSAWNLPP